MYRPTVRMADAYKDFVEEVASVTRLDRTQVIRLALFTAAHSPVFLEVLEEYKKEGVSFPSPAWELWEDSFFLEVNPTPSEGKGGDVTIEEPKEEVKILPKAAPKVDVVRWSTEDWKVKIS